MEPICLAQPLHLQGNLIPLLAERSSCVFYSPSRVKEQMYAPSGADDRSGWQDPSRPGPSPKIGPGLMQMHVTA